MAQELPSPGGACSPACHHSTAPVLSFPCAARGKQERCLHRDQLENPSVLWWQGLSPGCARLSVSVPFPQTSARVHLQGTGAIFLVNARG